MDTWPIAELVPHAADMLLIEQLLHCDSESVSTALQVRPGGLFNRADGSLPAWLALELMAQSIAAYAGYRARSAGLPVELGFLLGTRRFDCTVETFPLGSTLRIDARCSLEDDSGMGVFECRLSGPGILAEARLNVYRPPQVARYLQESAP
ncbi:TPA: 3-hydroxy-fatty acyl-ACP dehydratase [Klebsiella pneumoniae]